MTRFVQIGDLHLGRLLHGRRLLEDQRHALDQVLACLERENPDSLLITGDVYDRSVPPAEAVTLLSDFLTQVVRDREIPVIMIPGNHDSAERLAFGARLFEDLVVAPTFGGSIEPVWVGEAAVWPVPYLEPARVRSVLEEPEIRSHQDAMGRVVQDILVQLHDGPRVLVGHGWVSGASATESERPLAIGGAETIGEETFSDFQYVAMGHLHRPQAVGPRVHYAGSLLAYSASEIEHEKSITIAEVTRSGVTIRQDPITPLRALRRIEGVLDQVLSEPPSEDYVIVALLDEGPVRDAMQRVRRVFPNALHVERPAVQVQGRFAPPCAATRALDPASLFARFFAESTGAELSADHLDLLSRLTSEAS